MSSAAARIANEFSARRCEVAVRADVQGMVGGDIFLAEKVPSKCSSNDEAFWVAATSFALHESE